MFELKAPETDEATPPLVSSPAFNVAETAFTNGVLGAIGIATGVIAARWLGPEGRGELAAIHTGPSIMANLAVPGRGEGWGGCRGGGEARVAGVGAQVI